MPSKMVLVAAVSPHIGPWVIADGTESSLSVCGAGDVGVEYLDHDSESVFLGLHPTEPTHFPRAARRYRIVRRDAGEPVTVRVHI